MQRAFRASAFVPRGRVVDDATSDDAGALITVRSVARASACPGCGSLSERVHSRYRRRLADLPISGRPVRLVVLARRFYCNTVLCGRRVEAREIVAAFQAMVRKRALDALKPWLERAGTSLVASFANGVLKDKAAVATAITSPWSNGQTEGQITKLKLVKRQMYGRGKLDLLQARVIGAT